jgi:hypothetical protein
MSLEGPNNINKPPIDPSMTMGRAIRVQKVSRDDASAAEGKNSENPRNGAGQGPGIDGSRVGQALLMIQQGDNNIRSTSGFFKGKELRDPMLGAEIDNPEIIRQVLISDAKANGIPIGINTQEATRLLVNLFHAQD